eukprot:CAMPEP_0180378680 /NCGR_PEP_ID=MMETSP0989-20121125/24870_1 /TAXON_ID=697907 /ORGANISM="non described non described, Strain CCMP2293" /LENGTH=291 /DNA_ID=CAMNT_0022377563 /DNA_START=109 /DNA_END=980 /DNA_ORIENTATION=-
MELDSDPMIPEPSSASPPRPGQANPPPPCQTNAVKLCDLSEISVRTFSTSGEDLVIQAHKAALITHGLASAWRSVPAKEPTPFDPDHGLGNLLGRRPSTLGDHLSQDSPRPMGTGEAAHRDRRSSLVHHPSEGAIDAPLALPPTFELWVFGTGGQLDALGKDAAVQKLHAEFPTTPASDALLLLGDCLLLLSAAFTNRAERLLLAGGFVRLGDNLVPRGDTCAAHAPPMLPALQLECFLRDAELMALIFVKLVRVQLLGDVDALGSNSVEVLVAPGGMPGVLKPACLSHPT